MSALRIGTRRSDLALAQAGQVRLLLQAKGIDAQIVAMTTAGDEGQPVDVTTSPAGLKGLFIDTIVSALRDGEIDLAVHSAKDLSAEEEDDLVIGAVPERADPRDVLILRGDRALAAGMWVGTSSVRRRAQLLAAYPGVEVAHLRGNVPTRLRKLDAGDVDAVVLAAAGLDRLGIRREHTHRLGVGEMLPAPGQGCLAVQCRAANRKLRAALTLLEHHASGVALETERALVRRLGGNCDLPLGAIAAVRGDTVRLAAIVASPDGSKLLRAAADASLPERAAGLVADALVEQGADAILASVQGT
ncbi:MAG: hydroxymethylbilane synthase [Actinobacteria bacterium]|nr:MAG: hydroxymethylbilane synthase [Actinomycetota bacterium]